MLYKFLRPIAVFLFKIFFRIEVKGKYNIPKEGGVIIASNHLSNLDPVVLGVASPRRLNFLAKEELFRNQLFSRFIKSLGAIPLKREKRDISAVKKAYKILKREEVLVIFPQGSRIFKGKIYPGVGFLAKKANVPVVPTKILGTDKILPPGKGFFHLEKIKVVFGRPFNVKDGLSPKDITERIFSEIKNLK